MVYTIKPSQIYSSRELIKETLVINSIKIIDFRLPRGKEVFILNVKEDDSKGYILGKCGEGIMDGPRFIVDSDDWWD